MFYDRPAKLKLYLRLNPSRWSMKGAQQVRQRVHCLVVDADFIVKMRTCGPSGWTDLAKQLSPRDGLIKLNVDMRKMTITRRQTTAMVHNHELSIPILPTDKRHATRRTGNDRRAKRRLDILTGMKLPTRTTKRIPPSAQPTFKRPLDGPQRRRVATLSQNRFIGPHIFLEAAHLGCERSEAHLVERQRWST